MSVRTLVALALVSLLPLSSGCGSGSGHRDEDELCRAVMLAFADNEPERLVSLLPDDEARKKVFLAQAWEQTDTGEQRIRDDAIRRFYLKRTEEEWMAGTSRHAQERAALARRLAWRLDRIRDDLANPRKRDLDFRRFRETGQGRSFGDRDVARAEIVEGVLRFRLKDEEFACEVELLEVDRRWYLGDLGECDEVLE